jgi:hypothetical protein
MIAIQVPPGAVAQPVSLTAQKLDGAAPAGALGPVFEFLPEGTTFAVPARITFPITAFPDAAQPTIYWSNESGGYDAMPTTVEYGTVWTSIMRLGRGYVGSTTP